MRLKLTSRRFNKVGDDYGDFICANQDDSGATVKYYGFTSIEQFYFILRETNSSSVYTYDYYRMPNSGAISNYSTDWTNRASKSYQRYDLEFA